MTADGRLKKWSWQNKGASTWRRWLRQTTRAALVPRHAAQARPSTVIVVGVHIASRLHLVRAVHCINIACCALCNLLLKLYLSS